MGYFPKSIHTPTNVSQSFVRGLQVTVTGTTVVTSSLPYYALVVTGGKVRDYSPTSSTERSW